MWLSTSFANCWVFGSVMSALSHFALSPASFMPTSPMVEKWLSKLPRYRLV